MSRCGSTTRAEALPYQDASFDAVVFTCVLSSVEDPDRALAEARRVLRPPGGSSSSSTSAEAAASPPGRTASRRLWSRVAGGCRLNRDIAAAATRAGFDLQRRESFDPFSRLVPTRPMLAAVAVPASTRER